MTAPDVVPGYLGLVPEGMSFDNEVAARIALKVMFYTHGRAAARLQCLVLFCVCGGDSVAPSGVTLRHAAKVSHGKIKLYPDGHFDIYRGDAFERVVSDQLDFLERQIPR